MAENAIHRKGNIYALLALGPILFLLIAYGGFIPLDQTVLPVIGAGTWILLWWFTEVVPIPVTSLLPLVLFPILGILNLNATASNYANPIIFLYLSGFFIALALEKQNLHVRISLFLVKTIGTKSNKIVLGFMVSTAFLSMWISNTAATLLMLPIATSVIKLLEPEFKKHGEGKAFGNFAISMMLCLTYSAVIGGSATIIGTPVNTILVGFLKEMYDIDLTFVGWFVLAFPMMAITLIVAYLILVKILFRVKLQQLPTAAELIENKVNALGPITYQQYAVGILFVLTALGWIFRGFLEEWFKTPYLNDTIIGMTGGLLMFLVPDPKAEKGFLLDWEDMGQLPWGVLFLIGGGLALAQSLETSGAIKLIGDAVTYYGTSNYFVLLAILIVVNIALSEFIGNTAQATIALPMVFGIANANGIDPILLGVPITFAVSFGFMLPMATAPNAIVFGAGYLKIKDMAKAGILLDIFGFILLMALSWAYHWVLKF